jgi:hypothetical protein
VLLATLAIRRIRRRGLAFAPTMLLGITLSIVAYWTLLFWVVIGLP